MTMSAKEYGPDRDAITGPPEPSWGEAIKDCRSMIELHERRVKTLRGCIKVFEQFIKDGTPFPGEVKT